LYIPDVEAICIDNEEHTSIPIITPSKYLSLDLMDLFNAVLLAISENDLDEGDSEGEEDNRDGLYILHYAKMDSAFVMIQGRDKNGNPKAISCPLTAELPTLRMAGASVTFVESSFYHCG